MQKLKVLACFYIIIVCLGCDNSQKIDRGLVKEEIAKRELKKVTEAEILNEATQIGRILVADAEKFIEKRSDNFLEDHITDPIRKANINWIHNLDSLENIYDANIKYLSLITSSDSQLISPIEEELLDAYQYNLENNISLTENIQKAENDYLLYNKPIILNSSSCLRCHGIPGVDIPEHTLASINENYPTSKVHGYVLGSVLGVWNIRLSQKKIIQDF